MSLDWIFKPTVKIFGPDGAMPWESYDALKGLLIILIVIGHNTLLTSAVPYLDWVLYNFHVGAFLLLPFLFVADDFTWPSIRDKLVRYLWPYLIFVIGTFLIHYNMYWAGNISSPVITLKVITNALIFSNALSLKAATGFALFWFLPALTSLLIIRSFVCSLQTKFALVAMVILMAALWLVFYSDIRVDFLPFGIVIALYMLPVGMAAGILAGILLMNRHQFTILLLSIGVFVFLQVISITGDTRINVGSNQFQQHESWDIILLHVSLQITGFVMCLLLSRYLTKIPFLQLVGKHSLLIYLTHSLIYQALIRVFPKIGIQFDDFVQGAIIFAITLAIATMVSLFVYYRAWLRNLIQPRDLATLKTALHLTKKPTEENG